jgi:PAS domain S-box-containing protein
MKSGNTAHKILYPLIAFILLASLFVILKINSLIDIPLSELKDSITILSSVQALTSLTLVVFVIVVFKEHIAKPLHSIMQAVKGEEGIKPTRISEIDAVIRTLNDSLEKQKQQIEELDNFKRLIELAFDMVVITDNQGAITYVNKAFENITGYRRDEVLGQNPGILKSEMHSEEFYKEMWAAITSGNSWKGEIVNRRKDGALYNSSATIFPLISQRGEITHYVSIQRDITEEKRLYDRLLRAQKMESIGTLAGGIAHDFNNLLTAILGYSDLMLSSAKEKDEFYKPLTTVRNAAERGSELAKKILTISRKERFEPKPLCLNTLITETNDLLKRSIPKSITTALSLYNELPLINGDYSQIQQIILNLVVNAKDAMPDGGQLTIETSLVGKENGAANGIKINGIYGYVKLSVSDTGTGMDEEVQRKIFDPFFTTKEGGRGTGLGLYIVHSIVNNHGGYINLYSEPDKGTRFNIYFPAIKSRPVSKTEEEIDIRGNGTVLVIDDEEHVRELIKDLLGALGYNVMCACNGEEGIKTFRENKDKISIVLLDMIMPRMGGKEVFQSLKTLHPDARIIICSGYSHEGFAGIDDLLAAGARGFVQKPFTMQTIGTALKKSLSE